MTAPARLLAWQVDGEGQAGEPESAVFFLPEGEEPDAERAFDETGVDGRRIERAPAFDAYAPGPVPPAALLAAGWWFRCAECERRVSADGLDEDDLEEDEEPCPPVVARNGEVYCSEACVEEDRRLRRERKTRETHLRAEVLRRFPEAAVRVVWSNSVDFTVPSCEGAVSWRDADPNVVTVRRCDVEAWKKYVETRKKEP